MRNIGEAFNVLILLSWANGLFLNDVLTKFEHQACIEDDFIESQMFDYMQKMDAWNSITSTEDTYFKTEAVTKSTLSTINDLAQKNDIDYYYYLESEKGSSHEKVFVVSLKLGDEIYKGEGKSIKEAKRHAGDEALLHTNYAVPEQKEKNENILLTPTVELNNLAMKLGMKVTYLSEDELIAESFIYKQKNITIPNDKWKSYNDRLNYTIYHPYERKLNIANNTQQNKPFKVGVIVGDLRFIGIGYTLQYARHDAASKALFALKQLSPKDIDHCIADGIVCNPDNVKSPISLLYEIAQKKNIHLNFEVVGENGPAHEKEFVTKCKFGDLTVEGTGKSKKLSKRNASENMLEKLKHTQPSHTSLEFSTQPSKKKKKKKIIKSSFEKLAKDTKSFLTSSWEYFTTEDNKNKMDNRQNHDKSYKDNKGKTDDFKRTLLGFTQENGISVQFVDLGNIDSKFYSLVFLGIKPNHICLGDGLSYDLSREKASTEALNFFHKLGIENLIPDQETFKFIGNMDFGKMYVIDDNVINEEKSKKS